MDAVPTHPELALAANPGSACDQLHVYTSAAAAQELQATLDTKGGAIWEPQLRADCILPALTLWWSSSSLLQHVCHPQRIWQLSRFASMWTKVRF